MQIDFKGEKIPMRISYYAIKMYQEETKKTLTDLNDDLSLLEVLVWYAIVAGHKVEGKKLTFKREDVEWLLDESLAQVMVQLADQNSPGDDHSKKK